MLQIAERAAAALFVVGGTAENAPDVPLAFDKVPPESFQLLDDSLDFLRRVFLPWY